MKNSYRMQKGISQIEKPEEGRRLALKIKAIGQLYHQGKYAAVISHTNRALAKSQGVVPLLIFRGMAIQLLDGDTKNKGFPSLGDAKKDFELAVRLDGSSVEALTELAHFHFSVLDSNRIALRLFQRATRLSMCQLKRALMGTYSTSLYLGQKREQKDALKLLRSIFPNDKEIRKLTLAGVPLSRPPVH